MKLWHTSQTRSWSAGSGCAWSLRTIGRTIIGYDQDLWSNRLRYHEVDVHDALDQFTVLRRANMRLWQNLGPRIW